jgi:hypothetical protein
MADNNNDGQKKMYSQLETLIKAIKIDLSKTRVTAKTIDYVKFGQALAHAEFPEILQIELTLQQVSSSKIRDGGAKLEFANGMTVDAMLAKKNKWYETHMAGMENPTGAIMSKVITIMWVDLAKMLSDQKVTVFANIDELQHFNERLDNVVFLKFKNARLTHNQAINFLSDCADVTNWDGVIDAVRNFVNQRALRAMSCLDTKVNFADPEKKKKWDAWAQDVFKRATTPQANDAIDKARGKMDIVWPVRTVERTSNKKKRANKTTM